MKPRYILLLILGLFNEVLYAQQPEPFFRQYTMEQGLPSNNVYRVHKDKKGYLWFATDNGISRFDGHHFENFTQTDGFTDFGAYHIIEDKWGRIWFLTFSGRICYYENGRFNNIDSTFAGRQHIKWIMEDPAGELYFTTRGFYITTLDKAVDQTPDYQVATHGLVTKDYIYAINKEVLFFKKHNASKWHIIKLHYNPAFCRIWQLSDGRLLVSDFNYLYELKGTTLHPLLTLGKGKASDIEGLVVCLYENSNHDIWLGTSFGIYVYKQGNFKQTPIRYKKECNIFSITQDHEKNYWFTTGANGIYKLSHVSGPFYSTKEGLSPGEIISMSVLEDKLLVSHQYTPVIDLIDSNNKITHRTLPLLSQIIHNLSLIPLSKKQVFLQCTDDHQLLISLNGIKKLSNIESAFIPRKQRDNVLLGWVPFADDHLICELDPNKRIKKIIATLPSIYEFNSIRIQDLWVDRLGTAWVCNEHNLYRIRNNKYEIIPLTTRKNEIITPKRIQPVMHDRMWIATKGAGMYCLDTSGKILQHLSETEGLASNNCNFTEYNGKDRLWVTSPSGVSIINLNNGQIMVLNEYNLLPSNQVTGLIFHKKKWHIATTKGLLVLDEYVDLQMERHVPPPVYIRQVSNNGQTLSGDSVMLSYGEHNLTINYTGICFTDANKLKYKYRLNKGTWTTTTLSSIVLSALAPGSYLFEVFAVDGHGSTSRTPAHLWIKISPPFWRTWWFYSLVFLLASGIMLLAIFIRINRLKQQNMLEKKLLRTELQMLHLQMNPHFLFNTLQSIQHYILEHRRELAVSYLAKFSKLMRLILNHSKRSSISLTEEINFLNLYIELEQLRFNDQFSYQVNLFNIHDPEEIRIPPMVVQPFVENAIKYGLNYRKIEGRLDVGFSLQTPTRLKVTIEDNGVGRAAVKVEQERFGKEFASTGISHTRDRMMALFDYDELHLEPIEIIDLHDAWNIPCGTRVVLHIPV